VPTIRPQPPHDRIEPRDVPALVARFAAQPSAAILQSTAGAGGRPGRWTFLAADPRLAFEATGDRWTLKDRAGNAIESGEGDPLETLGRLVDRFSLDSGAADVPPFSGGWIGHLGYDLAPRIERLPRRAASDSRIPDLRFALFERFVSVDHESGEIASWCPDARGRIDREHSVDLDALLGGMSTPASMRNDAIPMRSNVTRDEYLDAVRRGLDYIRAGDIFQVNLSQRFEGRGRVDPMRLYLDLAKRSPAAYSALIRWDDLAIVSASPECFYETRGDRIVTRPIKGTRPRGRTLEADARLIRELRESAKDRAELTMIVDLERNDLGRVCRYGTVKVSDPLSVETFAQVHHLVATVEGRLRPEVGPIDVIRAMFPGGSITGAPKIRAMEIIDELEPNRRSVYTGAIGFLSRVSTSFNIAIRTILVEGDRVTYQVGGGIVADSDPESEYEETLHKGAALKQTLENPGGSP